MAAALLGRDVMISGGRVGDWAVVEVQVMPQEEPGVSFRLSSQINSYEVHPGNNLLGCRKVQTPF